MCQKPTYCFIINNNALIKLNLNSFTHCFNKINKDLTLFHFIIKNKNNIYFQMMGQTDTETNIKVVKNMSHFEWDMLVLYTLGKACSSNNVPL